MEIESSLRAWLAMGADQHLDLRHSLASLLREALAKTEAVFEGRSQERVQREITIPFRVMGLRTVSKEGMELTITESTNKSSKISCQLLSPKKRRGKIWSCETIL